MLIALLTLGFFIVGCADGDKSVSTVNPNPDVFSPVGSISGVVHDYCTDALVKGAVVSVAYGGRVHSITTSSNGAYSFDNVPANKNGRGDYFVSCDLTKVTGYGYAMVEEVDVHYSDLGDGTNDDLYDDVTEAGSGSSTPVNHLAATLDFEPGPLTSAISGTIYDVSTGRVVSGAVVSLYQGSTYRASVTSTDGTYSFANIMPGPATSYKLMVIKAGYEYAALQAPNTVAVSLSSFDPDGYGGYGGSSLITPACNLVDVKCEIGCGQAKAGINVNMIANPAKDLTTPYIVSVAGGGETDIISDDYFPDLDYRDFPRFVVAFSEAMATSRSIKDNGFELATDVDGGFEVTVTTGGSHVGPTVVDIVDSYTVTMSSTGVMLVAVEYKSKEAIKALVTTDALYGPTATVSVSEGGYDLEFFTSPHLTDASGISWYIGTPGTIDSYGFLHSFGEAYQNNFILGTHWDHMGKVTIYVGAAGAL